MNVPWARRLLTRRLPKQPPDTGAAVEQTIFLVHGHDEAAKANVARFLERATSLDVTILHERPNQGMTILEKFERHARSAAFAVVLLAADDVARAAASKRSQKRGRQNVVFELGFFVGALGRDRVAVLLAPGVERPSDIEGLAWIGLDGNWQLELARELRAAEIKVDLSRI